MFVIMSSSGEYDGPFDHDIGADAWALAHEDEISEDYIVIQLHKPWY